MSRFFTPTRVLLVCIAALVACLCLPHQSWAVTSAEKQAEADAAKEKVDKLQEELDDAEAEYGDAQIEEQKAQEKVDAAQAKCDEAQSKIDAIQKKIDKAKKRIKEIKAEIAELQEKISSRARSMYRSGATTMLDVILNSSSFEEFATNWDTLNAMNQNDSDMVEKSKSLKAEQEEKKAELEEDKAELVEQKEVLDKEKEELEAQEAVVAEKAAAAEAVKNKAEAKLDEMEATYKKLSKEASKLLKEEQEAERKAAEAAAAAAAAAAGGTTNDDGGIEVATGNTVVDRAYSQMGKWYRWGATGPETFDCSGLVGYALTGTYKRIGTTWTFMKWERTTNPQPGDICTNTHHCGIYIGGGKYINAPHTGAQVRINDVPSSMIYVKAPSSL